MDYSIGLLSVRVRKEINPQLRSSLLLPSAALYTTPLSSRDLIMAGSLAMRTEPICVCEGLKRGTNPMCKRRRVSEEERGGEKL